MKIIDLNHPHREFPVTACGLVLGNFDGVHRGHMALIEELKRLNKTRKNRLPLGALCFAEHPSKYFGKPVPMLRVGVEDCFGRSGPALELLELYGLTAPHIAEKAKAVLALK